MTPETEGGKGEGKTEKKQKKHNCAKGKGEKENVGTAMEWVESKKIERGKYAGK